MNITKKIGLVACMAVMFGATAVSAKSERFIKVGHETSAPIGHVQFCKSHPRECLFQRSQPRVMQLTRARWDELLKINDDVNHSIEPITDLNLYNVVEHWTFPANRGDCEDYVLLKRKILIDRGWPPEALLITVVRDTKGDGHAILTARTDYGEFILDNQIAAVLPWSEVPYQFVKRQSTYDIARWQQVFDHRFAKIAHVN